MLPSLAVSDAGMELLAASRERVLTEARLRALIDRQVDLDVREIGTGNTPLMYMSVMNNVALVRMLVENGCKLDVQNTEHGMTALHAAAFTGSIEVMKLLLENKANLLLHNKSNYTALDLATMQGNTQVMEVLQPLQAAVMKTGVGTVPPSTNTGSSTNFTSGGNERSNSQESNFSDGNHNDTNGNNISTKTQNNTKDKESEDGDDHAHQETSTYAYDPANDHADDENKIDDNVLIPSPHMKQQKKTEKRDEGNIGAPNKRLFAAIQRGTLRYRRTLEKLIDSKADINARQSGTGNTPLMIATTQLDSKPALWLLKLGARLDLQNTTDGVTALHFAVYKGSTRLAQPFLRKGGPALISIRNKYGETALDLAVRMEKTKMARVLKACLSRGKKRKRVDCIVNIAGTEGYSDGDDDDDDDDGGDDEDQDGKAVDDDDRGGSKTCDDTNSELDSENNELNSFDGDRENEDRTHFCNDNVGSNDKDEKGEDHSLGVVGQLVDTDDISGGGRAEDDALNRNDEKGEKNIVKDAVGNGGDNVEIPSSASVGANIESDGETEREINRRRKGWEEDIAKLLKEARLTREIIERVQEEDRRLAAQMKATQEKLIQSKAVAQRNREESLENGKNLQAIKDKYTELERKLMITFM